MLFSLGSKPCCTGCRKNILQWLEGRNTVVEVDLGEQSDAQRASSAAKRSGVSLSAWLDAATERALIIGNGLAAVADWEAEHDEFSANELVWADTVLGMAGDRPASER